MIPRHCYFYWGGGPLSYLQYLSVKTFKDLNPDWCVKLLMPKTIVLIQPPWDTGELLNDFIGEDYLERTKEICDVELVDFDEMGIDWRGAHDVQKGDFLKWHVLHDRGGLFSDIDILYLKPLDELMKNKFDALVCYVTHAATGFLMAKPKQKMFKDLAKLAESLWIRHMWNNYQGLGPGLLSEFKSFQGLQQVYPETKLYNLPMDIVYPYKPGTEVYELFFGDSINKTTKNTVGIHWYNGNFVAKEYQNHFDAHRHNGSYMSELLDKH